MLLSSHHCTRSSPTSFVDLRSYLPQTPSVLLLAPVWALWSSLITRISLSVLMATMLVTWCLYSSITCLSEPYIGWFIDTIFILSTFTRPVLRCCCCCSYTQTGFHNPLNLIILIAMKLAPESYERKQYFHGILFHGICKFFRSYHRLPPPHFSLPSKSLRPCKIVQKYSIGPAKKKGYSVRIWHMTTKILSVQRPSYEYSFEFVIEINNFSLEFILKFFLWCGDPI